MLTERFGVPLLLYHLICGFTSVETLEIKKNISEHLCVEGHKLMKRNPTEYLCILKNGMTCQRM